MMDYAYTLSLADNIDSKAKDLRAKANSLDSLTTIVGRQYSGTDAEAFRNAVIKAKSELSSTALELNTLAQKIRSAAASVKEEEEAAAAAAAAAAAGKEMKLS